MTRIFVATLLLMGAAAHADIDRSQYKDLPATYQNFVATVPVNPDDDLPREVRERHAGKRLYGEYMVYVGAKGAIDAIDDVKPIADCSGCDALVHKWIDANHSVPPGSGRARRFMRVDLSFPPPPGAKADSTRPPPTPAPPGTKPQNVPPHKLWAAVIEREDPHLPDSALAKHPYGAEITVTYFVTVGTDGHVTAVDPTTPNPDIDPTITATLKRWRFKPLAIPLRTMLRFSFTIPPQRFATPPPLTSPPPPPVLP